MSQNNRIEALKLLQILADKLEHFDHLDTEIWADKIIVIRENKNYLLNYHGVMDEIWYSSPVSGAHHFMLVNNDWICTRTKKSLDGLLQTELMQTNSL